MNKKIITAAAASIAFAALTTASVAETGPPPARYNHPYRGELTIWRLPQKEVHRTCLYHLRTATRGAILGCALPDKKQCFVIIIDKPYHGDTPEQILQHEIGHCNGWQHK